MDSSAAKSRAVCVLFTLPCSLAVLCLQPAVAPCPAAIVTPEQQLVLALGPPKRAPSSFLLFSQVVRPAILKEHPGLAMTDAAKEIGARWRMCRGEERAAYDRKALEASVNYEVGLQAYEAALRAEQEVEEQSAATAATEVAAQVAADEEERREKWRAEAAAARERKQRAKDKASAARAAAELAEQRATAAVERDLKDPLALSTQLRLARAPNRRCGYGRRRCVGSWTSWAKCSECAQPAALNDGSTQAHRMNWKQYAAHPGKNVRTCWACLEHSVSAMTQTQACSRCARTARLHQQPTRSARLPASERRG